MRIVITSLCKTVCLAGTLLWLNACDQSFLRNDLEAIQAKLEVTRQQASPRLVSCTEPHSKVTLKEEPETHAKTHLG